MNTKKSEYRAIVSSDWNECLAPCGPFDYIGFHYPDLKADMENIFRRYTGGLISLDSAVRRVEGLLPKPISKAEMDAYLDSSFSTYSGVGKLIDWCFSKNVLFMINTTGVVGYFQRILAKQLLPLVPVISAFPRPAYPESKTNSFQRYDLYDISDKSKNTDSTACSLGIPPDKVILMGDSGGDGPHFKWGAQRGAYLIGVMPKPSLQDYCQREKIQLHHTFGVAYRAGEPVDFESEMKFDFMDLAQVIDSFLQ